MSYDYPPKIKEIVARFDEEFGETKPGDRYRLFLCESLLAAYIAGREEGSK